MFGTLIHFIKHRQRDDFPLIFHEDWKHETCNETYSEPALLGTWNWNYVKYEVNSCFLQSGARKYTQELLKDQNSGITFIHIEVYIWKPVKLIKCESM